MALSPTVRITRTVRFSAAHRYHTDALSAEENARVFGKCNRPHGHGHDYRVDVAVDGPVDEVTGMVMNLADLDRVLKQVVVEPMDHSFLNFDVEHFAKTVPTCENIALYVADVVKQPLEEFGIRLASVRVYETDDLFVDYELPVEPSESAS